METAFAKQSVRSVETTSRENQRIASLDPLRGDALMQNVPVFNRKKDIIQLVLLLVDLLPTHNEAEAFDAYEANAAVRDIGILIGSVKRHGVEPVNVIPHLEEKMNLLAAKNGLPPRDTLLHYTIWNPTNHRRRTYTGTDDESYLIDSVVVAMDPLVAAIGLLEQLHRTPMQSPGYAGICGEVQQVFGKVVEGVVMARRFVSPAYFANELRLYFDPIHLNSRTYLGPGAVEMPMFVFDHLLWSSDCPDAEYRTFKETYVPYLHHDMRRTYRAFDGKASLVTQACRHADECGQLSQAVYESLKALAGCCRMLKSFRMPHKKIADEAYAHTRSGQEDANQRTHGSGGYSTEILSHLIELTRQTNEALEMRLRRHAGEAYAIGG